MTHTNIKQAYQRLYLIHKLMRELFRCKNWLKNQLKNIIYRQSKVLKDFAI